MDLYAQAARTAAANRRAAIEEQAKRLRAGGVAEAQSPMMFASPQTAMSSTSSFAYSPYGGFSMPQLVTSPIHYPNGESI